MVIWYMSVSKAVTIGLVGGGYAAPPVTPLRAPSEAGAEGASPAIATSCMCYKEGPLFTQAAWCNPA